MKNCTGLLSLLTFFIISTQLCFAFDQGINEESNPALRNNDVVLVGRSVSATLSDNIGNVGGVLNPLGGLFSPIRLILDLFD